MVVLILTLLFWFREAMRDYDHVGPPVTALVPVTTAGPPPGIHVPGPSFRPILASIAMAALFFGFVFGGYLLIAGAIMLAIALLQWLVDARREYRGVVVSDVTGHLPADPRPNYPRGTLAVFAVVFTGAVVLKAGILPPKTTVGGTGASGAPPSGAPARRAVRAASSDRAGRPRRTSDVRTSARTLRSNRHLRTRRRARTSRWRSTTATRGSRTTSTSRDRPERPCSRARSSPAPS